MKLIIGTVLIGACVVSAFAADKVVPMRDVSPRGSPLQNYGRVSLAEATSGDNLRMSSSQQWTVRNISPKPVVTIVESLSVVYPSGLKSASTEEYELFFHPELMKPGDELSFSQPAQTVTEVARQSLASGDPKCEVSVLWVQFADGTTFGDEKYAMSLFANRRATFREMLRLRDIYANDGAESFLREIGAQASPGSTGVAVYRDQLRTYYNETKDIQGTYSKLMAWIDTAASRQRLLD